MKNKNKNIKETMFLIVLILLILGFLGLMVWLSSLPTPPQTKMTARGWDKENGKDVWVCREYKQINYKL